nr:phosphotransferase [Microbacterium esteraromaticum]
MRIGSSVRKPATGASPAVHALLRAVRARGVAAPEPYGFDAQGRQVLEFVPGVTPDHLDLADLARVGALVRSIHDAAADFHSVGDADWDVLLPAPGAPELICHNDLAPWNLIVGERWLFIDWDGAGPSTRLWDLAYSASAFTLNDRTERIGESAARLRALVDGYGADDALRDALPNALAERTAAMRDMLADAHAHGREPWATMHSDGHGAHWSAVADHVRTHREQWARALRD